jgi:hypothetical protein
MGQLRARKHGRCSYKHGTALGHAVLVNNHGRHNIAVAKTVGAASTPDDIRAGKLKWRGRLVVSTGGRQWNLAIGIVFGVCRGGSNRDTLKLSAGIGTDGLSTYATSKAFSRLIGAVQKEKPLKRCFS